MIFRPYYYFDRGCAAYLFGCGTLGRCAVVDAGWTMWRRMQRLPQARACASRT